MPPTPAVEPVRARLRQAIEEIDTALLELRAAVEHMAQHTAELEARRARFAWVLELPDPAFAELIEELITEEPEDVVPCDV